MIAALTSPRLFPIIILALFALAAIRFAWDRNWSMAGYWCGALILNFSVLAMGAK